jgi:hypothetical protein
MISHSKGPQQGNIYSIVNVPLEKSKEITRIWNELEQPSCFILQQAGNIFCIYTVNESMEDSYLWPTVSGSARWVS